MTRARPRCDPSPRGDRRDDAGERGPDRGARVAVGVADALVFLGFEWLVKHGTDWLWNDLAGSDDERWRVIPLAIVLSLAFSALLRALKQPRWTPPHLDPLHSADGEEHPPAPTLIAVALILVIGAASLLAGASLGPEAALVATSIGLGTWAAARAGLGERGRLLALASAGALLVAFLGSLIALAIPLLLLYQRTKRLAPAAVRSSRSPGWPRGGRCSWWKATWTATRRSRTPTRSCATTRGARARRRRGGRRRAAALADRPPDVGHGVGPRAPVVVARRRGLRGRARCAVPRRRTDGGVHGQRRLRRAAQRRAALRRGGAGRPGAGEAAGDELVADRGLSRRARVPVRCTRASPRACSWPPSSPTSPGPAW